MAWQLDGPILWLDVTWGPRRAPRRDVSWTVTKFWSPEGLRRAGEVPATSVRRGGRRTRSGRPPSAARRPRGPKLRRDPTPRADGDRWRLIPEASSAAAAGLARVRTSSTAPACHLFSFWTSSRAAAGRLPSSFTCQTALRIAAKVLFGSIGRSKSLRKYFFEDPVAPDRCERTLPGFWWLQGAAGVLF